MWKALYSLADVARRAQGQALAACGFGTEEQAFRVLVEAEHWRPREYAGGGDDPSLLIVAAPIKQPYVWDLAPAISACGTVYRC